MNYSYNPELKPVGSEKASAVQRFRPMRTGKGSRT